jgi:hypothetical protein
VSRDASDEHLASTVAPWVSPTQGLLDDLRRCAHQARHAVPGAVEQENALADIADFVHTQRTHTASGVCHGDNEGCEGGPDAADCEAADAIWDLLVGEGMEAAR